MKFIKNNIRKLIINTSLCLTLMLSIFTISYASADEITYQDVYYSNTINITSGITNNDTYEQGNGYYGDNYELSNLNSENYIISADFIPVYMGGGDSYRYFGFNYITNQTMMEDVPMLFYYELKFYVIDTNNDVYNLEWESDTEYLDFDYYFNEDSYGVYYNNIESAFYEYEKFYYYRDLTNDSLIVYNYDYPLDNLDNLSFSFYLYEEPQNYESGMRFGINIVKVEIMNDVNAINNFNSLIQYKKLYENSLPQYNELLENYNQLQDDYDNLQDDYDNLSNEYENLLKNSTTALYNALNGAYAELIGRNGTILETGNCTLQEDTRRFTIENLPDTFNEYYDNYDSENENYYTHPKIKIYLNYTVTNSLLFSFSDTQLDRTITLQNSNNTNSITASNGGNDDMIDPYTLIINKENIGYDIIYYDGTYIPDYWDINFNISFDAYTYSQGYTKGVASQQDKIKIEENKANNYKRLYEQTNANYEELQERYNQINDGNSLYGMIVAIADTPINIFKQIFNFDILGINISGIVFGLISLLVIIWLIKKLI